MRCPLALLGIFFIFLHQTSCSIRRKRIYNGFDAPEWLAPYQVAIIDKNWKLRCGGAIVTRYAVITAAHCFRPDELASGNGGGIIAKIGTYRLSGGGIDHDVEEIILHPEYNRDEGSALGFGDLAILKLLDGITFSQSISPIPIANQDFPAGTAPLLITGWGKAARPDIQVEWSPDNLQMADDQVLLSLYDCQQRWNPYRLNYGNLCAWSQTSGSCGGDSGGPLAFDGQLIGVVSGGPSKCSNAAPDIYTNLYQFRDWIMSILWNIESAKDPTIPSSTPNPYPLNYGANCNYFNYYNPDSNPYFNFYNQYNYNGYYS